MKQFSFTSAASHSYPQGTCSNEMFLDLNEFSAGPKAQQCACLVHGPSFRRRGKDWPSLFFEDGRVSTFCERKRIG
ncbi:hypothetical protein TNCT_364491 [Trichonephila clavata]|uniref:Uncharacterized protein n=1 Tax=Trichonephila clavata TaxID=2740835 RepID=A0A8X6L315_TRICU|nr:hypothetical protein TNCT_364491 [Trichonephila clavata]